MENALEVFLMQEQLAVISSSQPLEAQQRACYKNDLYCESNEPSIYSYNLFRKNLKVSERSFEVFSLYRKVRLWLLSKRKIAHIKVGRANR